MASKIPVITSDRSALKEVTGDAGINIDPDNAKMLGQAMVETLSDPKKRTAFIERGSLRVKAFDEKKVTGEVMSLYQSLF